MIVGEMCLLIVACAMLIGIAKGITARLYLNDYIGCFFLFVIVLLNARGGIKIYEKYELYLGGILSVLVAVYFLVKRSETAKEALFCVLSAIGTIGISFIYFTHFTPIEPFEKWLVPLAALPIGLWCAVSAKRTFAGCLFSALFGTFVGATLYTVLIEKSGAIGGRESFAVMWLGALTGLFIQYLLTVLLRATGTPGADTLFEAGELQEEQKEDDKI